MCDTIRAQYRDALSQEDGFFTCPLCEKCPVCSISATRRKMRTMQNELSLNMPFNWTSSFTSPRKGPQQQGMLSTTCNSTYTKYLKRSDSTITLSPQQNIRKVKMNDTLEEKNMIIDGMREDLDELKAENNLLINKLQYADIEVKQYKARLYQKDKDISMLNERVRLLEGNLKDTEGELDHVKKSLITSEQCRSHTTKELARCRQENKSLLAHLNSMTRKLREATKEKLRKDNNENIVNDKVLSDVSGKSKSFKQNNKDHEDVVDISQERDEVIKRDLLSLMNEITAWSSRRDSSQSETSEPVDILDNIYSQLQQISTNL